MQQPREKARTNQVNENLISLVRLNPVTAGDESVKRGLYSVSKNTAVLLTSDEFKDILLTDATTEEGELAVLNHFQVGDGHWQELLDEWQKKHNTPLIGFRR